MRNLIHTAPNMPKIRTYEKLQLGCRSIDRQTAVLHSVGPYIPGHDSHKTMGNNFFYILSFHFHWVVLCRIRNILYAGNKQMCHWKWSTDRSIGRYSTDSRMSIFLIWSMANFMHSIYSRLIYRSIDAGLRKSGWRHWHWWPTRDIWNVIIYCIFMHINSSSFYIFACGNKLVLLPFFVFLQLLSHFPLIKYLWLSIIIIILQILCPVDINRKYWRFKL